MVSSEPKSEIRLRGDEPTFADNRAKLHLLAAASHLVSGGRLAAVLPLSLQGIDNLLGEGYRAEWMDTFDNEFDNTAVSVRVLYVECL